MSKRGYLTIEVADFLDEVTDDDLVDEMKTRKLTCDGRFDRDYAERAFEALQQRRYAAAETFLDRALRAYPPTQDMKGLMTLFANAQQRKRDNSNPPPASS